MKKLTLRRETVLVLLDPVLENAVGGGAPLPPVPYPDPPV